VRYTWLLLVAPLVAILVACGDNHDAPADAQVDATPPGCTSDAQCDDNDACTIDTCNEAHECVHTPKPVDDQIACTTDACDPTTGEITHTPVDAMCEQDGKTCTVPTCSPTTGCSETATASVCDDGATCSTDACDPTAAGANATTGCTYTLDNSVCADSFSCTTDTCAPSALAADPTTGCLVAPDDAACDDSLDCTADTCDPSANGADAAGCVHQPMDDRCELDGKSCTVATCSATSGCSETPQDSLCDDNATCSTDTCSPTGPGPTGCVYVLDDNACADTAECSIDACSPGVAGADATTGCAYTPAPDVCDGNATCSNQFDCICDAGYDGDGLTCTGITCDALADPANGSVATSNAGLFPSTALYTCDTGFAAITNTTRTCNPDGTWSGSAPRCHPTVFVVRVGTGAASLTNASAAVFLEERDAAGTLLRTVDLPTEADGDNAPFTISGTATTEGGLSLSADGAFVTLAGYAVGPGVNGPNNSAIGATTNLSTEATPTNRVVARVASDATIDTSTSLVNAFSGSSVRAACSVDGAAFWLTGASQGVLYAALGTTGAPTAISNTVTNLRHAHIFASQLYVSSGSGATTRGVLAIGTGTPSTAGQLAIQVAPFASTLSPDSFAVLDLDPDVDGVDTIYVAADTGGTAGTVNVQKWMFDGAAWIQAAAFAPTVTGTTVPNTLGLATWVDDATVHIVVTTTDNRLLKIVDDGATDTPAATVLATAATNTAFRGVARSPAP
jgi:hypothetical protein